MANSTTNLILTKPEATDATKVREDANSNADLIDAQFEDVLEFDTSPVLRGNLDIATFNIEGVDATEFSYLNGISSFGGTLIDDANASAARTTLGLAVGTNVQAFDNALTSISGLTYVSGSFIALTANDTYAVRTYAQTLTDIGGVASGANTNITSLTGLTTPLGAAYGGTGVVNNVASTLTISGNFATTITVTEATGVTLPASGTLVNTAVTSLSSLATIGTVISGTLSTGAVLADVTMTLGTDADGDVYYRASNKLTRLAKGSATQVLTMNAGATAPEWTAAGGGYTNLTSFVDQTAFRVFYSNTAGDVIELALGADGTYLKSNGAAANPSFAVPAGAGDVSKVGTPVDSQVGVWTGDGTIEGAASFTYDGANLQMTGDVGATGTRITKGWFANLETTGDLTVNGTALASTYATLGANTNITSILNIGLYVGRDADNQIKFATDNNIIFRLSGADGALFNANGELDMNTHTIGFTQQSTTGDGTTTIDWKLGNKFKFTFGAQNDTFTFTAPTNPCNLLLVLIQDGTGSRLATWPGTVKWPAGTAPTLTTGANTIDIVSFYYDGTSYHGNSSLAFAVPA